MDNIKKKIKGYIKDIIKDNINDDFSRAYEGLYGSHLMKIQTLYRPNLQKIQTFSCHQLILNNKLGLSYAKLN